MQANLDDSDVSGSEEGSESIDSSDLEDILQGQRTTEEVLKARKSARRGNKRSKRPTKKRKTGVVHVPVVVTSEIKELEKLANLHYVNGQYADAIGVLEQIIKECPKYAAPYHMMGSIHSDLGNNEKSLGFAVLAASLSSNDPATWLRIGKAYVDSDPKLAMACLKRCIRLRENAEVYVHLALVYEELNLPQLALTRGWERAWEFRRKSSSRDRLDLIAQPLAKAYYRFEKWNLAREVLEICLDQPPPTSQMEKDLHTKTIFFLSDVLLGPQRMFRECADMLLKHLGLDGTTKLPLPSASLLRKTFTQRHLPEILKNLAVSLILSGCFDEGVTDKRTQIFRGSPEAESLICIESMYSVLEQPYDTFGDMILELIDAMIEMNHLFEVNRIINRFQQDPSFGELPPELLLRTGKVAFRQQDFERALAFLGPALEHPDLRLSVTDKKNLRIMVAEIHHHAGNFDECSRVLLPLSFHDLISVKQFPPAMSTDKRKEIFLDLCQCIRDNNLTADFVPKFTHLVHDCELDFLRVGQARINDKPERENPKGFIAETTARRRIGLESIESIYGMDVWLEFVRCGGQMLARAGKTQMAVEILEGFITGRKNSRKLNEKYGARLQNTSMVLAVEAGITKVAFKYVRQHIMRREGNAVDERLVALFSRLLVASKIAYEPTQWKGYSHSALSTSHKPTASAAFSDYYKWAVRLLLSHPRCLSLMLLVGHMCILSGQYRTSAEEYERAYRIVPTHPMPPLCAAASNVSLAMSRAVTNRHAWMGKAFVYMRIYGRLREGDYMDAEVAYNEGRLFHQIGILHTASSRYRTALKILEACPDRCDLNALRTSTLYNLAQIYRSSGNSPMARRLVCRIVV